jgi:hypothetical protein
MAGAAAVIKRHVAKCGTKGNKKPPSVSSRNQNAASQRVGGYAGASFSNDIGRR